MGRIVLRDYLSRIERLLDDNRLAEAGAHCHFILQQYPRCLDAYRLLGRSLLEQQLTDDSIDVFGRILSADPEDLIAHAGIGLAYREQGDLARAIWHLDRAIELDPYNRVVRQERINLSARRGDPTPDVNGLTRAGLSRLYYRSGLFGKAIIELRSVLDQFPDRNDLQMLMAESLYWDGWRVDSVKVCMEILDRLPYCAKANAILADVWLSTERTGEARKYLERVYSLYPLTKNECDDQTVIGRALAGYSAVTTEPILVDELEEYGITPQTMPEQSTHPGEVPVTVGDGEVVPEWLLEIDTFEKEEPMLGSSAPITDEAAEDLPLFDWLQEVAEKEGDFLATEESNAGLVDYETREVTDLETSEETITEPVIEDAPITGDYPQYEGTDLDYLEDEIDKADLLARVDPEQWAGVIDEIDRPDNVPDWLYSAVGFADDLKELEDYNLPDWLQDAVEEEETSDQVDEPESLDEDISEADDQRTPLGETDSAQWESKSTSSVDNSAEQILGTSSEQPDGIPNWLKEDGEKLEELPDKWLDGIELADPENEPSSDESAIWLDELTDAKEIPSDSPENKPPDLDENSARPDMDEKGDPDDQT